MTIKLYEYEEFWEEIIGFKFGQKTQKAEKGLYVKSKIIFCKTLR